VWKLLNVVTKLEADGATLYDRQLHTAAILADRAYGDTDAVALGITFGAHPAEMPTRQTQTAEINSSRELRIPHLLLLVNLGYITRVTDVRKRARAVLHKCVNKCVDPRRTVPDH
jgi:hypothetical protein